jgi:hypothetical protein
MDMLHACDHVHATCPYCMCILLETLKIWSANYNLSIKLVHKSAANPQFAANHSSLLTLVQSRPPLP